MNPNLTILLGLGTLVLLTGSGQAGVKNRKYSRNRT